MRKILTLVLLLSFACSEETEFRCESCINMTISDALPIQFWLNDCPTYNEKESCGVHSFCWNQKFHCDDEIRLQFTDSNDTDYRLGLFNESDELVHLITFDKVDLGVSPDLYVYSTSFVPSDLSPYICNEKVQFKIIYSEPIQFINPSFIDVITPWQTVNLSGKTWEWVSGNKIKSLVGSSASDTDWITQEGYFPAGQYKVQYTASNLSTGGSPPLQSGLVIGAGDSTTPIETGLSYTGDGILLVGDTNLTKEVTFTLTDPRTRLFFRWQKSGSGGGYDADIELSEVSIIESPFDEINYTLIAKSDFIEFSTELGCTELIKYRNERAFAGIDYPALNSEDYFYLRIPAVFFHEQFPGEDEAIELSDSKIINLNGVMRAQKRLETDYIPYYMHKKIQLILKHQFVEIEGQRWTKQDAYEITEGNKRYPLKMAKCWLTERNFVARNVV